MILVLLVVFVLICLIGIRLSEEILSGISACAIIISVVAIVCLIGAVCKLRVIDEKISMYTEENARIETQIAEVIEQYQEYEANAYQGVKPESAMTLIAMYPDLKSDALVQAQIEVYVANNEKIKELREQKINGDVYRWWLYFGRSNNG